MILSVSASSGAGKKGEYYVGQGKWIKDQDGLEEKNKGLVSEKDGIECDGGRPQVFVTLAKTRALEEADAKKRKEEDFEKSKEKKVPPPLPPKTEDFEKDVLARMRKIAEDRKKAAAAAAE